MTGPRWTPLVWLVYLPFVVVDPLTFGRGAVVWVLTVGSMVVFLALYLALFTSVGATPRGALLLNAGIAALGFALLPVNSTANTYLIYASAGVAHALRPRDALLWIAALMGVLALELTRLPASYRWWMGVPTLILIAAVGGSNIYHAERERQHRALRRAEDEIEELATVAERDRIARDLHDLLGHTLSVIALKSELASRLAERDPSAAAREIREVEQVSRQALTEVRRAVEGYQQHGIAGELRAAERALATARVAFERHVESVTMAPRQETVVALALREAVTNVLRHAGATRCRVTLRAASGEIVLTVEDNGQGRVEREGYGLAGMRARVAQLGGRLSVEHAGGVRVTVAVPA